MNRKKRKPWWPELSEEEKETIDYWYKTKEAEAAFWQSIKNEVKQERRQNYVRKTHTRHPLRKAEDETRHEV